MSKSCGDTARFNRIRKQRVRSREKIRAMREALLTKKPEAPAETPKS